MEKVSVYEKVNEQILAQLDDGIIPWHKPWFGIGGAWNRISGNQYSLLNQLLLRKPGEWASFKQWSDAGATIRKGAKSRPCVFYTIKKEKEIDEVTGEEKVKSFPILRCYSVFHIDDVDGVEQKRNVVKENKSDLIDSCEEVIHNYIARTGVKLHNSVQCNRAYYSCAEDCITVPRIGQFESAAEYYSTVFHEMAHSTGVKSRLARELGNSYGSNNYAKEELVAELASCYLCQTLGISLDGFKNSTAYIKHWRDAIANDNRLIIRAAGAAEKAVKYILGE